MGAQESCQVVEGSFSPAPRFLSVAAHQHLPAD